MLLNSSLLRPKADPRSCRSVAQVSVSFQGRMVPPPGPGQVTLAIHAAALNFRDVLIATNLLPDRSYEGSYYGRALGMEASGVITAIGPGVEGLALGDRVATSEPDCFANRLNAPADRLVKLPATVSLEVAACTQSVYNTAHHALVNLARIKKGKEVLEFVRLAQSVTIGFSCVLQVIACSSMLRYETHAFCVDCRYASSTSFSPCHRPAVSVTRQCASASSSALRCTPPRHRRSGLWCRRWGSTPRGSTTRVRREWAASHGPDDALALTMTAPLAARGSPTSCGTLTTRVSTWCSTRWRGSTSAWGSASCAPGAASWRLYVLFSSS
jgi:hypothetical protein